MEEEELACLRAQQRAFQELRNNELAEVQRLQEQERRRREEKVGRIYFVSFCHLFHLNQGKKGWFLRDLLSIKHCMHHSVCLGVFLFSFFKKKFLLTPGAQNCPAEGGAEERKRDCREDCCPGIHAAVLGWPPTISLQLTEKPRLLL